MSEDPEPDDSRRTFMKGAAATGLAVTGLGAFGGSAAAQQNIRSLNVSLTEQNGLLNVNISNVNALNNVNVEDIVVTVIGGDVLSNITVDVKNIDVDVTVKNVLTDFLNDSVVQVAVVALSDTGDIVAQGCDALNL